MTNGWDSFPRTAAEFPGLEILASTPSTNQLLRDTESDLGDYSGVLTTHQTQGRGRLGREWVSRPGESIAVSILCPPLSAHHRSWLSLVVGASLTQALRNSGLTEAEMKWPNDVLLRDEKVAGVLCEALPSNRVIAGIGLNVDFGFTPGPAPNAVALSRYVPVSPSLVDAIVLDTLTAVRARCEEGPEKALVSVRAIVEPVLATLGKSVTVHEPAGDSWGGLARNLSEQGHVLVETVDGEVRTVVASDIEHLRQ